ncbi:RPAP3 [Acanthosepion pharaonis]|uniref:RNA polymerase II-associated protein 3 n=1 Tax=Acanthosepion pharaonis TaxID=158019 RepID=A0A812CGC9_ACAPH|nr:RPAP3 [Sepia pharaonis]
MQMRENNLELQDYLRDLDNWEGEMKKKEENLKEPDNTDGSSAKLPPVRNSSKKKKKTNANEKKDPAPKKPIRIKSSDYAAWEKFDVDKACEEVLDDNASSDSEFCESDEELEDEIQKQQALKQKDKGNEFFKLGNYAMAIDHYSFGIQLDPANALLLANRAMALLKQEKFAAAEQDCYSCLSLDPTYVKGYLRRATARSGLKKYEEAIADYEKVLNLEPGNKMASAEIKKLQKLLPGSAEVEEGIVNAIDKSPAERSKKPLRRLEIQETGIEDDGTERREQIAKITEGRILTPPSSTSLSSPSLSSPHIPSLVSNQQIGPDSDEVPDQLQYYWPHFKKNPKEMYSYLKRISPEQYPQLVSEFVDSEMVTMICSCLKTSFLPDGKLVIEHLTHLSKVNRFQMAIMFLSPTETKVIKDLFNSSPICPIPHLLCIYLLSIFLFYPFPPPFNPYFPFSLSPLL